LLSHADKSDADFELPQAAFDKLNTLEKHHRYNFPARWGVDVYSEVGDESAKASALKWAAEQKALAAQT
jgi:L-glyceraldehyde reductase